MPKRKAPAKSKASTSKRARSSAATAATKADPELPSSQSNEAVQNDMEITNPSTQTATAEPGKSNESSSVTDSNIAKSNSNTSTTQSPSSTTATTTTTTTTDSSSASSVTAKLEAKRKAREARLFAVRGALGVARKANLDAVVEEKAAAERTGRVVAKEAKVANQEAKKSAVASAQNTGVDVERTGGLHMTASQAAANAEWEDRDTIAKLGGFRANDTAAQHLMWNRKLAGAGKALNKSAALQKLNDAEAGKVDPLDRAGGADPEGLARARAALTADESKRSKAFSRSRRHPDELVDGINDSNDRFNRKLDKHFNQFTEELKQNLERGTAL